MEQRSSNFNQPTLTCNICTERFLTNSSLRKHLLQHIQTSFKCEKCSKIFTNIQQLKDHEQNHTKSNPEKRKRDNEQVKTSDHDNLNRCNICKEKFGTDKHYYYKHIIKCAKRSRDISTTYIF